VQHILYNPGPGGLSETLHNADSDGYSSPKLAVLQVHAPLQLLVASAGNAAARTVLEILHHPLAAVAVASLILHLC
jgi:hypothetical protein